MMVLRAIWISAAIIGRFGTQPSQGQDAVDGFVARTYAGAAGASMPYRLFIPARVRVRALPPIVYLHGSGGAGTDKLRQIAGGNTAGTQVDIGSFAATIQQKLKAARYMEQDCQPLSVPGWEGFETQNCTYRVKDRAAGTFKAATVVMLNPSALKLSEWIINACTTVLPDRDRQACAQHVFGRVLSQSGGQYPVAGVVYEDLLPADGINEAYGFRDGVTCVISGFPHRGTQPLTEEQTTRAASGQVVRTASQPAFARPIGVTRNEYLNAYPGAAVANLDWLTTVRTAYQRAWRSDRNALIEAWLKAHPP